jgi:hypothetical protein
MTPRKALSPWSAPDRLQSRAGHPFERQGRSPQRRAAASFQHASPRILKRMKRPGAVDRPSQSVLERPYEH